MQSSCNIHQRNYIALSDKSAILHHIMVPTQANTEAIDKILAARGLRRTHCARSVLGWLCAHPNTSYTHLQLQAALRTEGAKAFDRVTLYRQIDRLRDAGLLYCRVDASRVRHYQLAPTHVKAALHFECQSCRRDSPLAGALKADAEALEQVAQKTLDALQALGYEGMSMDFAVRGLCADCVVGFGVSQAPQQ